MEKVSFWFPIVCQGVLFRSPIHKRDIINIVFFGHKFGGSEYEYVINESSCSGLASGRRYPKKHVARYTLEGPTENKIQYLKSLKIPFLDRVLSAFHFFLKEKTDIEKENLKELETVRRETYDPYHYLATLISISLKYIYYGDEEKVEEVSRLKSHFFLDIDNIPENIFDPPDSTITDVENAANNLPGHVRSA